MNDLSHMFPVLIMMVFLIFLIVSNFIILKKFYKKAKPGEVLVLNTTAKQPKVIRNGVLVLPIIHSVSTLSLNTQAINIDQGILKSVKDRYSLNLNDFSVQIENSDQTVLTAYQRVNNSGEGVSPHDQLKSVIEHPINEAMLLAKAYDEFKEHLSKSLHNVGYELVV